MNTDTLAVPAPPAQARSRRTLAACCGAHALHDGFSDLLYVMFPVWQLAFGLSFAQVGLLKTLYSGSMAALQVPASLLAERVGERVLLALGTLVAAAGFLFAGWTGGFLGLGLCLMLSGAGASVQHPLASTLTSRVFEGAQLRTALGTYNFSGDVGKVLVPALCAALLAVIDWHAVTSLMGVLGLVGALAIWFAVPRALPRTASEAAAAEAQSVAGAQAGAKSTLMNRGFISLSAIGVIDSATRMGFLTLLPFVLIAKGASVTQTGFALSLTFAGGAAGKFICGMIAARAGVLRTTILTELATAAGIVALLPLSLEYSMLLLPVVGVALNGTSSVLYGTVAELVPGARRARAFGVFYTLTIGAGAVSPALYGLVGDHIGVPRTFLVIAALVLLVLPLTLGLRAALRPVQTG
ncbi:MAG: MFS transporter [Burkholderiales bacterium]|nr:MFS transporter [Burkholderiales bacterium]